MIEHQEHYGRKFYQDKSTGYWISTDYPRIRAHRWVWITVNGNVPKTCHIHHKDENKSNNCIENLEIVTFAQHAKLHMSQDRSSQSRDHMDNIRPLTKEWHASPEGRAWHKYHAIKCSFGNWEPKTYECQVCKKIYETTKRSNTKFCSNPCKSKFRRDSGLDHITKTCKGCFKEFSLNKYAKTVFCSKNCAQQNRKRLHLNPKTIHNIP
jgi:hypothetical protein